VNDRKSTARDKRYLYYRSPHSGQWYSIDWVNERSGGLRDLDSAPSLKCEHASKRNADQTEDTE